MFVSFLGLFKESKCLFCWFFPVALIKPSLLLLSLFRFLSYCCGRGVFIFWAVFCVVREFDDLRVNFLNKGTQGSKPLWTSFCCISYDMFCFHFLLFQNTNLFFISPLNRYSYLQMCQLMYMFVNFSGFLLLMISILICPQKSFHMLLKRRLSSVCR